MAGLVRKLILTMTPLFLLTDSVPSRQFVFKRVDLSCVVQTTALEQSTRRSRLDCARGCASNAECFSFGFLSGSRLCRQFPLLVSRVHVNQTEENPDEKYYWKLGGCLLGLGYMLTSDGRTCLGVRRQPLKTFVNANLACQQEGAHLLVLRDKQHMDMVIQLLNQTGLMGTYFVGLTDLEQDGNFRWLDGTAVVPSVWKPGHPNNFPNQHCGVAKLKPSNFSLDTGVNDLDCDVEQGCHLGLGYMLTSDGSTCLGVRREPLKTFVKASLACQQEGAHLLVLRDKQHMDVVIQLLNQTGHTSAYYVGLTDLEQDGNYRWLDGTAVVPSLWKPGRPNNYLNQDCGVFTFREDHYSDEPGLNDLPCDAERKYICQISVY